MAHRPVSIGLPGRAARHRTRASFVLPVAMVALANATSAGAQIGLPATDLDPNAVAIRCELRTIRAPDATQVMYFYVSDARRTVLETDGNPLGNIVQFNRQRILVTRPPHHEGGIRYFVFDRMIGSLTITAPGPVQGGTRDPAWTLSGECLRMDASKPKF